MFRRALAASLIVVASGSGCSSTADVLGESYAPGVFPKVAYSGHNPNATFKVLFSTSARDPQWSVGNPSIATIAPAPPPLNLPESAKNLSFALVTSASPGETTVSMRAGGRTLTSKLVINAYTDEQLAAGKARYETPSDDPTRPPCASCHAKENGVDHSPRRMAGFDDETILGIIQQATYPPSPTGQSTTSDNAPTGPLKFTGHKWNLTDLEKVGILARLRSLALGGL